MGTEEPGRHQKTSNTQLSSQANGVDLKQRHLSLHNLPCVNLPALRPNYLILFSSNAVHLLILFTHFTPDVTLLRCKNYLESLRYIFTVDFTFLQLQHCFYEVSSTPASVAIFLLRHKSLPNVLYFHVFSYKHQLQCPLWCFFVCSPINVKIYI